MKNNKGITMVELIVSVALISVAIVFLFKMLVDLKYEDNTSTIKPNYLTFQSLITKYLQDNLDGEIISSINNCSFGNVRCLSIMFTSNNTLKIQISNENQVIEIKKMGLSNEELFYERRQIPEKENGVYGGNLKEASISVSKVTKGTGYNYKYDSILKLNIPLEDNNKNIYNIDVFYLFNNNNNTINLATVTNF